MFNTKQTCFSAHFYCGRRLFGFFKTLNPTVFLGKCLMCKKRRKKIANDFIPRTICFHFTLQEPKLPILFAGAIKRSQNNLHILHTILKWMKCCVLMCVIVSANIQIVAPFINKNNSDDFTSLTSWPFPVGVYNFFAFYYQSFFSLLLLNQNSSQNHRWSQENKCRWHSVNSWRNWTISGIVKINMRNENGHHCNAFFEHQHTFLCHLLSDDDLNWQNFV